MEGTIKYSILVCTLNGKDRISTTLSYIANLDYSASRIELVIVDNGSKDGTSGIISQFFERDLPKFKVRILSEEIHGKQRAMWTGFRACVGQYVVICDDDNWLSSNYLKVADQTIERIGYPVVLGGSCIPVFHTRLDLPPFFYSYGYLLALGASSLDLEDLTRIRGWVMGAGSIFPKKAIDDLESYNFKHQIVMSRGEKLSNSEDLELCYALTLCGWRIFSQPNLVFKHFIPEYRISESYIQKLMEANHNASIGLKKYVRLRQVLAHPRGFTRIRSASLFFLREPNRLNLEALIYCCFGKKFPYKLLPIQLLTIKEIK